MDRTIHGRLIKRGASCKCAATQVGIISWNTACPPYFNAHFFFRAKCCPKRGRDLAGKLTLKTKRISQCSVVMLCPEVAVGARVDQLHIDGYAISDAPHTAFEHISHAQRLADLPGIARPGIAISHD